MSVQDDRYNQPFYTKIAMVKILAFSGSIRRDAWNRKLIQCAVNATRAAGGDVTLIDLADYPLPLYNGDLEDHDGLPNSALRLKALFKNHDALLICSPEYNSSIPPLLKNTLDWVSREWQDESGLVPYQNKVAAIMAASPGQQDATAARLFDAALAAGGTAAGPSPWGLVVGARADALVIDSRSPAQLGIVPSHRLDALVFSGGEPALREVLVAGEVVLQGGRHRDQEVIANDFAEAMRALWSDATQ